MRLSLQDIEKLIANNCLVVQSEFATMGAARNVGAHGQSKHDDSIPMFLIAVDDTVFVHPSYAQQFRERYGRSATPVGGVA